MRKGQSRAKGLVIVRALFGKGKNIKNDASREGIQNANTLSSAYIRNFAENAFLPVKQTPSSVCVCVRTRACPHTLYIINLDATDLVEEMYPLIGNIIGQPETRMGIVKGVSV